MSIDLRNRNFLTLKDFSKEEIEHLINLSSILKKEKKSGVFNHSLKNKNIACIFEKTSTRTRCAASVACFDEGAHAEFLGKNDIQLGKKESIKDTARVLGGMFDSIIYRGFEQSTVEILAQHSGKPIMNALTNEYHPTQTIADFLTIKELFGTLNNIKLAYIGDGRNNVSNSLLIGCSKMGLNFSIGTPKSLFPENSILEYAEDQSKGKSSIQITEDPYEAASQADVIYTDVWVSMGEEENDDIEQRIKLLTPYQINTKLIEATKKEKTAFLHCLPATHKNEIHCAEVTEEVFESPISAVFQQAENRLHSIKAILVSILGGRQ